MTSFVRNLLLLGSGLLLAACETQPLNPDQAPEYEVIWSPTPFYQYGPRQPGGPNSILNTKTRLKLLRKKPGYSFVQLEDSRTGYVANRNIEIAVSGTQKRPFGSTGREDSQTRPFRKKPARINPPSPESPASETPSTQESSPPPPDNVNAPAQEAPSPTPQPETPVEKPKFRL